MSTYTLMIPDVTEYHPADIVKGKVSCVFTDSTFSTKEICVELVGKEETSLLILDQKAYNVQTRKSKGYNKFLELRKIFHIGSGDVEHRSCDLEFSFRLPEDSPSSYTCNWGTVNYFLRVIEPKENLLHCLGEITVVASVPNPDFAWFDSVLSTKVPYSQSIEKNFSLIFCCTLSGGVILDLYLPKRAFVQGQQMPVRVDVCNESDEKIQKVELIIGQTIQFRGAPEDGYKFEHRTLVALSKPPVEQPLGSYEFNVEIPKNPVLPNFARCKLFDQKFWIDAKVVFRHDLYVKLSSWISIGQISDEHAISHRQPPPRRTSRTRDHVSTRTGRPLLPSTGPAPYSSYRQRPAGFSMAQPIVAPVSSPSMPLPPNASSPENSSPYPPTAGPSQALPDELPPTYEEAVRSNISTTNRSRLSNQEIPSLSSAVGVSGSAPYPPQITPHNSANGETIPSAPPVFSSVGVPGSAPYPSQATPLFSDSIGFGTFPGPSQQERRSVTRAPYPVEDHPSISMSMPMPRVAPYPLEIRPGTSAAPTTSMPLPYSTYSGTAESQWDTVRAAVPLTVRGDQLYPPERPSSSGEEERVIPMRMPMPMEIPKSETPKGSGRPNTAPYPIDTPLLVSEAIGFAVHQPSSMQSDGTT